jgi:hypothetical protein
MKKTTFLFFTIVTLLFSNTVFAQVQSLSSAEEPILLFKTLQGKTISLSQVKNSKALFFKIEKGKQIELQYPQKLNDTTLFFTYSFYLRGGGTANEGMELNYVYFELNNLKYVLFENSHSSDPASIIGLKIIDVKTQHEEVYEALANTIRGSLISLRNDDRFIKGEELFD